MFKKWYAIKGITNELFDVWKNDLRSDILWWKEPEEETQLKHVFRELLVWTTIIQR